MATATRAERFARDLAAYMESGGRVRAGDRGTWEVALCDGMGDYSGVTVAISVDGGRVSVWCRGAHVDAVASLAGDLQDWAAQRWDRDRESGHA